MVRKIGFRPDNAAEYDKAMGIYIGKKVQLVANTTDPEVTYNPAEYFCLMN